jgi:hypothetical protein
MPNTQTKINLERGGIKSKSKSKSISGAIWLLKKNNRLKILKILVN